MGWSFSQYDIGTALAYVFTVVVTYGSQAGAFGKSNKQISAHNPTPITPAGWAFAIWGVIFLGEAVAVAYLLLRNGDNLAAKQRITATVGVSWVVGWLAEAAWQFVFVQDNRLGMIVAAVLLVVACGAFQSALRQAYGISGVDEWARRLIVGVTSVNAAWLSVATVVGIAVAVRRVAPPATVLFSIFAAVVVTMYGVHVTLARRDAFYCATLTWAFVAVFLAQRTAHPATAWTAAGAALASATAAVLACVPDSEAARAAREADANVREALVGEP